jgi:hypothetical protein
MNSALIPTAGLALAGCAVEYAQTDLLAAAAAARCEFFQGAD